MDAQSVVTARIVTSELPCFVGRLSKKKQTLTTVKVQIPSVLKFLMGGSLFSTKSSEKETEAEHRTRSDFGCWNSVPIWCCNFDDLARNLNAFFIYSGDLKSDHLKSGNI